MRRNPVRSDTRAMRRIENMKTMNVHPEALNRTARHPGTARTVRPEPRPASAADTGAAIERQLDEIQRTFGARWEW
jgi:hypothetical protein